MGERSLRGRDLQSKDTWQLLCNRQRRRIGRGTHALGAAVWFPIGQLFSIGWEMIETRTLQFESPRALQSLYANDLKLLKSLEDSLGVRVTTREGWVKLEGEPSPTDKAQHGFAPPEHAP